MKLIYVENYFNNGGPGLNVCHPLLIQIKFYVVVSEEVSSADGHGLVNTIELAGKLTERYLQFTLDKCVYPLHSVP